MEQNCDVFVIKNLYFVKILDIIWTWILNFLPFWTMVGLGLSFKYPGLNLDRKI